MAVDDKTREVSSRSQAYSNKPRIDRLLKVFTNFKQDIGRFLDIGCGDGAIALLLKSTCHATEVYGLEQNDELASLAKQKGIMAYTLDVDKNPYPFPNDCFDAVFAGEVLEHLNNPDHFFEEIHRILRK